MGTRRKRSVRCPQVAPVTGRPCTKNNRLHYIILYSFAKMRCGFDSVKYFLLRCLHVVLAALMCDTRESLIALLETKFLSSGRTRVHVQGCG